MLTDTHCHLDFEVFDKDREKILNHCINKDIKRIIVPSVVAANWKKNINLCSSINSQVSTFDSQFIVLGLGLHPYFLSEHTESDINLLENFCKTGQLKFIGEIGLDYYLKDLDKGEQYFYFESQLRLAKKYGLPIIIHARKSHQDIIQLLKKYSPLKGIIHAFNGSEVQASQYAEMGFKLGFGGAFTYPRAKHLRKLVATLPLTSFLLETDAPDMKPLFEKTSRNTPENLIGIYNEFVSIRSEGEEVIEKQLEENIVKVLV